MGDFPNKLLEPKGNCFMEPILSSIIWVPGMELGGLWWLPMDLRLAFGLSTYQEKASHFHETEMGQSLMRTAQALFRRDREQITALYSLHGSGKKVEGDK